jgi:hypothetical protein
LAIGAINIVFVAVYAADALRWTLRRGQQPPQQKRQHHAEDCIAGQHLARLAETKHTPNQLRGTKVLEFIKVLKMYGRIPIWLAALLLNWRKYCF